MFDKMGKIESFLFLSNFIVIVQDNFKVLYIVFIIIINIITI